MAVLRDGGLNLRVTEDEKTMVERAADLSHMTTSRSVPQAALRAAAKPPGAAG
jgi:uncharacterized protein (DUF1778 family)